MINSYHMHLEVKFDIFIVYMSYRRIFEVTEVEVKY